MEKVTELAFLSLCRERPDDANAVVARALGYWQDAPDADGDPGCWHRPDGSHTEEPLGAPPYLIDGGWPEFGEMAEFCVAQKDAPDKWWPEGRPWYPLGMSQFLMAMGDDMGADKDLTPNIAAALGVLRDKGVIEEE